MGGDPHRQRPGRGARTAGRRPRRPASCCALGPPARRSRARRRRRARPALRARSARARRTVAPAARPSSPPCSRSPSAGTSGRSATDRADPPRALRHRIAVLGPRPRRHRRAPRRVLPRPGGPAGGPAGDRRRGPGKAGLHRQRDHGRPGRPASRRADGRRSRARRPRAAAPAGPARRELHARTRPGCCASPATAPGSGLEVEPPHRLLAGARRSRRGPGDRLRRARGRRAAPRARPKRAHRGPRRAGRARACSRRCRRACASTGELARARARAAAPRTARPTAADMRVPARPSGGMAPPSRRRLRRCSTSSSSPPPIASGLLAQRARRAASSPTQTRGARARRSCASARWCTRPRRRSRSGPRSAARRRGPRASAAGVVRAPAPRAPGDRRRATCSRPACPPGPEIGRRARAGSRAHAWTANSPAGRDAELTSRAREEPA